PPYEDEEVETAGARHRRRATEREVASRLLAEGRSPFAPAVSVGLMREELRAKPPVLLQIAPWGPGSDDLFADPAFWDALAALTGDPDSPARAMDLARLVKQAKFPKVSKLVQDNPAKALKILPS